MQSFLRLPLIFFFCVAAAGCSAFGRQGRSASGRGNAVASPEKTAPPGRPLRQPSTVTVPPASVHDRPGAASNRAPQPDSESARLVKPVSASAPLSDAISESATASIVSKAPIASTRQQKMVDPPPVPPKGLAAARSSPPPPAPAAPQRLRIAPRVMRTSAQLPLDPIGNKATSPSPPPETGATQVSPGKGDKEVTLNVQQTDVRTVLSQLSQYSGLNILATKSVQGLVSASLSNVGVDAALEAILRTTGFVARHEGDFVYVGTRQELDEIEQAREGIGVRVYRPNYVTASELQNLITPMLTKSIGTTSISTAAESGIASDDNAAGGDSFAGAEALLVRDYETVLTQIDRIVAEVDARPLQVAIEATIIEVKLNDQDKVGVNFELLRDKSHARLVSGMPLTDLANMDITKTAGLKFGFLDSSLGVFLDALETVGDANVVASPSLLCLNKQRAEIHIGSEIGYITTTVTETVATESVEFLEVGTQLRLRPYISGDGMIRLELHPELSTGQVDANGLPDKDLTQVTTNVLVPDGRTVIIGGLIHENLETTTNQIPLLGNLPLVGVAFRQKTEKVGRNEIIVLVTPRIVCGSQSAAEGETSAYQYLQRQAIYADKMSPLGKRYDGRRYLRLAQAAWINGHVQMALKYVNLAIHFDPLNLQAVTLRDRIIAAGVPDTATVDTRLREGLTPWGHPLHTERLPAGVLEDLARPAMAGQRAEVFDSDRTGPTMPDTMEIVEPGKIEPLNRKKE